MNIKKIYLVLLFLEVFSLYLIPQLRNSYSYGSYNFNSNERNEYIISGPSYTGEIIQLKGDNTFLFKNILYEYKITGYKNDNLIVKLEPLDVISDSTAVSVANYFVLATRAHNSPKLVIVALLLILLCYIINRFIKYESYGTVSKILQIILITVSLYTMYYYHFT